jgi:hypothetical protein
MDARIALGEIWILKEQIQQHNNTSNSYFVCMPQACIYRLHARFYITSS